jgi:site-specific DNA-methyltransferase (adenine-specific)
LFSSKVEEMLTDTADAKWLKVPSVSINRTALEIDTSIKEITELFEKTLGAVIFSPPYANSFDYYESYKLELLFGDFFTLQSIGEERKKLIRSYRQMGKSSISAGLPTVELLIEEIMNRLPEKEIVTGVKDGRSRLLPNMLRGYFEDMQEFLRRAGSVMPTGSYMAIVVDQSAYLGVLVPTDLILAELAQSEGFALEKLVICRRAKTSGQQMNMQPILGDVLRETAVILRR